METLKKLHHSLDALTDTFNIIEKKTSQYLTNFLNVTPKPLKSSYQEIFDILLEEIQDKGDQWNEEELKMKFIALLFFISEIEEKGKIQAFYERPLSATIEGNKLSVKIDCMLAAPLGKNTPREPYFFLQAGGVPQFKKGKGDKFDPEAQMLAAMILAEHYNQYNHPVYGAFIVGKNWIFTVLQDKKYCRSRQYDASQKNDLLQIIFILRNLKTMILSDN